MLALEAASKPITGLMGGITGFLNTFDQYLTVDENKVLHTSLLCSQVATLAEACLWGMDRTLLLACCRENLGCQGLGWRGRGDCSTCFS
eukprot:3784574-Amphidinium_carterae.1